MLSRYILTVCLAGCLAGCGEGSSSSTEVLSPDELPPGDVTFGVTHVMTKQGVRSAILEADTAVQQENGRKWDLRGVDVQFFTETGAESGTLTSRSGEYTPDTGSFVARDSVVLITTGPSGRRQLETEELYYDVETEEVWSDSSFVLYEGGGPTRGSSFRSDVHGESWTAVGLETEDITTSGSELEF
jgi:LPS export ABC transporter protein LptC